MMWQELGCWLKLLSKVYKETVGAFVITDVFLLDALYEVAFSFAVLMFRVADF